MQTKFVTAVAAAAIGLALAVPAQAQESIKIGWAISKTGPYVGGAAMTLLNPYKLWVKDVNAAGGISLGGKKVPIEVVEYDDRSNSGAGAAHQPGQGRLPVSTVGHRLQPSLGADLRARRISADSGHRDHRPLA